MRWLLLLSLFACGDDDRPTIDSSVDAQDAAIDAGATCACPIGDHTRSIYVLSQETEIHRFDPATETFSFVAGPVCGGASPFSMAVDIYGVAWINLVDSLGVMNLDLLDPRACSDSTYLRTNPDFGLFGMSFVSRSAEDACNDLFVLTYSGDGPFDEGPGLGKLGVIDPVTGSLEDLADINSDGGELTGTGDGRLFGFAGVDPVKLVEYNRATGAQIETIPLDGVRKTGASAVAFYAGDIYLFVEAVPETCLTCLETECGDALPACRADETCNDHLECSITEGRLADDCGGGLSGEMMTCLPECGSCAAPGRARVSRVLVYDLDESDGGGMREISGRAPIRIVGAASSPCVPVGPI